QPPSVRSGRYDARRDTDGDAIWRNVVANDGTGAHDSVRADGDAVEDLGAGAHPGAVADRHAGRRASLLEHRHRWIREIVIASDDVRVGCDEHARADRDAARREDLAVEADVRAGCE